MYELTLGERVDDGRRVRLVLASRLGRACERTVAVVSRRRARAGRFARGSEARRACGARAGSASAAGGARWRVRSVPRPPRGFFLISFIYPNFLAKSSEIIFNFGVNLICINGARFPLVFGGAFRTTSASRGRMPCLPFGPRSCTRSQPSGTSASSVPWLTRWWDRLASSSACDCGCGCGCGCCSSGDCGRCCCCGCGVVVAPLGVGVGCAAFLRGFCRTSRIRLRSSSGSAEPLVAGSHVNAFAFGALRAAGPRDTPFERARLAACGAGAPALPPRPTPNPALLAAAFAVLRAASSPSFCAGGACMVCCVRSTKNPVGFGGKRRRVINGRASSHVCGHVQRLIHPFDARGEALPVRTCRFPCSPERVRNSEVAISRYRTRKRWVVPRSCGRPVGRVGKVRGY